MFKYYWFIKKLRNYPRTIQLQGLSQSVSFPFSVIVLVIIVAAAVVGY